MATIEKRDDGCYLDGRKLEDGQTLLRLEDDVWVADEFRCHEVNGRWLAYFGEPAAIGPNQPAPILYDAFELEVRWPPE